MKGSHSYNEELFRTVKAAVTMRQTVEHYQIKVNEKGLCLCPFHKDQNPSMKIYDDGKGFYCFVCGTGGDPINFVARYQDVSNTKAAKELAEAFHIPISKPMTYREKREAELARRQRKEVAVFTKRAELYLTAYRGLLCEAIHEQDPRHFTEALRNITYVEYLLECLRICPDELIKDKKVVKLIGEVEGRINNWYIHFEADGTISR